MTFRTRLAASVGLAAILLTVNKGCMPALIPVPTAMAAPINADYPTVSPPNHIASALTSVDLSALETLALTPPPSIAQQIADYHNPQVEPVAQSLKHLYLTDPSKNDRVVMVADKYFMWVAWEPKQAQRLDSISFSGFSAVYGKQVDVSAVIFDDMKQRWNWQERFALPNNLEETLADLPVGIVVSPNHKYIIALWVKDTNAPTATGKSFLVSAHTLYSQYYSGDNSEGIHPVNANIPDEDANHISTITGGLVYPTERDPRDNTVSTKYPGAIRGETITSVKAPLTVPLTLNMSAR